LEWREQVASGFRGYLLRRVIYVALTIFLILTFNYMLFRVMPGDVARIVIPKHASPETIAQLHTYYGLDKDPITQYVIYLKQTFKGELGKSISFRTGSMVGDIVAPYLTKTLFLVGTGTVISIFVGVILGRETAWRRGKIFDKVGSAFFITFYCMPTFLFAIVMITVVANYVPNWPISHETSDTYEDMDIVGKFLDRTQHLILPIFALVIETIATFSIITRSALIDVLTEDYMLTAVAKGVRPRNVLRKHAMPNALLPVVTVVAMNVGWILSGSIMIERIFNYQGLGWLTWQAVLSLDYPLLQGSFMLEAIAVVIANLIADIALFKLDPRVKL
jgi:ABC-type dipeptide/oligopeptide/nickel transport system permease component